MIAREIRKDIGRIPLQPIALIREWMGEGGGWAIADSFGILKEEVINPACCTVTMMQTHCELSTSVCTICTARSNFFLSSGVACTSLVPPPQPAGPPFIHSSPSEPHMMLVSSP
jgi:hypothetical protein